MLQLSSVGARAVRRAASGASPLASASAPRACAPPLRRRRAAPLPPLRASAPQNNKGKGTEQARTGPQGLDPLMEAAVPRDQRPVNELAAMQEGFIFRWASLPLPEYVARLAGVFGLFFALVGGPIAYQTFDPFTQPAEYVLSASTGSLVVVAIVVLRVFLGWRVAATAPPPRLHAGAAASLAAVAFPPAAAALLTRRCPPRKMRSRKPPCTP
jgi:hypothetical protein